MDLGGWTWLAWLKNEVGMDHEITVLPTDIHRQLLAVQRDQRIIVKQAPMPTNHELLSSLADNPSTPPGRRKGPAVVHRPCGMSQLVLDVSLGA